MLRTTLFFAVVGPLVGSVGTWLVMSVDRVSRISELPFYLFTSVGLAMAFYPVALALGLVPAIIIGVTYAAANTKVAPEGRLHPLSRLAIGGSLSAVFTAAYGLALYLLNSHEQSFPAWVHFFRTPLLASVFAGSICALSVPNPSFHRTCAKSRAGR